jgi:TetR/AcrR family transcriptional regulator, transcriptional repressor for nem operon
MPARPPPVTDAGKRTRDALLDAGAVVAERAGLGGLSVNAVVEQAGVAKGTFYVHFVDRDAFLDALHEQFFTRISTAVRTATANQPAGAARLLAGVNAYLDACLAERSVKPLLRELFDGACSAATSTSMSAREDRLNVAMLPNLRAMGCRDAPIVARLLRALIAETAMMERDAGRRLAAVRRSIRRFVEQSAAT